MSRTRPVNWYKYPIRTCRWMNTCKICGKGISNGELYRDGGYNRRAHEICCDLLVKPATTNHSEE